MCVSARACAHVCFKVTRLAPMSDLVRHQGRRFLGLQRLDDRLTKLGARAVLKCKTWKRQTVLLVYKYQPGPDLGLDKLGSYPGSFTTRGPPHKSCNLSLFGILGQCGPPQLHY